MTAEEMRNFFGGQGLRPELLAQAAAFREANPWQGKREVNTPRFPYFGTEILTAALTALLAGANLLLAGPKATGKNILAENLALLLGRPLWNVSFHIDVDASYLIGMDTFKGGEVCFRPGPVHECVTAGGICVLDEINMARNEALAVLHSLLDHRRQLEVPGYDRLNLHPATRFIATMNYGYSGTRELNEALLSRFVVIHMPVPGESELTSLLKYEFPDLRENAARTMVALFLDLRQKYEAREISGRALDLRGLLESLRLIKLGLTAGQAFSMGLTGKCFDLQERALAEDIIALRLPADWGREEIFAG
ncbi:AAA family ATPase [Selenomonas sp. FC4001]|uniref:AAA family ATPase n=1 Tax=Selenomonas sp. FC4001 TaxID=1408313 RepID=UPI000A7F77A4|nr:AAA family ATPase [Selenomonas sp. FC4001]